MTMRIIELILSKLGESLLSKVVDKTVDTAQSELECMKEYELNLKKLQKKLKTLIAKASDVEEEIKNAVLSGRKKRKREVEEWLGEVRSIETEVAELGREVESEGFITRLMDGGTPARLIDEVDELVEQSRNFGELVLDVCGTSGETLLTNGLVGDAFNENLETILKLLETRQVSSIGVYGMGGVGKTTLAKHIHNRLLQQSQGCVFWVTVSQEFTVTSLQDKIARRLGVNLWDEDNEDIRGARLQRALSQMKNPVLILDDVWENIDLLKVGCPFSMKCCRMIITTRSLVVCRQIRCQKVISVEKLPKDEAWKLFIETLGNEIQLGPQVEEIAKSMAKMCDGLPLGIITMAGSMRGETSIHMWKNACVELKECVQGQDAMGNDEVFKVLKYSFDRLNKSQSNEFNTLQGCFLYCSLYPEDSEIDKEDLVRKFISEGLVHERKSRRAQVEQGHSLVNKLVNVCLLENCYDYRDEECVKMHDLVRGMALKIGEGKYMVRAGHYSSYEISDEKEWVHGLEKVSLMMSGVTRIRDGISPKCPKLSTLLLCSYSLEVIPDSFFSKLQGLCTLDLCNTKIKKLPDSICDIKSLKALLLESCYNLKEVPYLGKLKALRELNLSFTDITEVPQGLEELLNLKVLSVVAYGLKMLPWGLLLKLEHLQQLKFPVTIQVTIEYIENLKQLEEFCGGVKNVNDFNSFIRSRVHDTSYSIGVGSWDSRGHLPEYFVRSYNNQLKLLECNLKDEQVLGHGIEYLTIRECEGLSMCFVDDLSRFNNPTSLKEVKISSCGGIEWILRSEQGLAPQISTLESIRLISLEDLKGVIQKGEIGAQPVFSSLRMLTFFKCNRMRKLGLPASGVPNLFDLRIEECGEIEEVFEDEGRSSVTLTKLRRLSLEELPRLKSVGKATMICNSIGRIDIIKCPRLMKKLPLHLDDSPPPSLRLIAVNRKWWESLEWDNPNLPQLLHPLVKYEWDIDFI